MRIQHELLPSQGPRVTPDVIPKPLPPIQHAWDLMAKPPMVPPELIEGLLHRGCKMLLGGTSKSNKSWCLAELSVCVASGQPWWGKRTRQSRVLHLNFELPRWAIAQRFQAIGNERPECAGFLENLYVWNLRGHQADFRILRPKLEERLTASEFGLIVLDPAYKVLGGRDENSNGDVADLMNEFENLAQSSGAALAIAHHFAKGDSTAKQAIDRMSGAGAWARDPDSILVLTPHEEEDCFTVTSILRNLPRLDDFVVRWDFPLMMVDPRLNPEALRRPQARNKVCTDHEFVQKLVPTHGITYTNLIRNAADKLGMSEATAKRYLARLKDAGILHHSSGLYWPENNQTPAPPPSETFDSPGF